MKKDEYEKNLIDIQKSNYESLDKTILTLSSLGLGFCLQLFPTYESLCLYVSCSLFFLAIFLMLISFPVSIIKTTRMLTTKNYKKDNLTIIFNISSVVCFILAMLLLIIGSINLSNKGEKKMEDKKIKTYEVPKKEDKAIPNLDPIVIDPPEKPVIILPPPPTVAVPPLDPAIIEPEKK